MQISTSVNQTMSSREIAQLTDKEHKNVLRVIRDLISTGILAAQIEPLKFEYRGQQFDYYELNKRDSLVLVARLSPEFTAAIVDRWQELESTNYESFVVPKSLPDALRLAAHLEEQRQELESKLAIAAPKAQFVDSYVNASGSLGFRETCKLLHIKENAFRQFLLESEIMYLLAGKLTPYAQHIDAGRFTVKTGENQNNGHAFTQNKFTPKGIQWIAGLWAAHQIGDKAA
ncbi:phage antirepressor KilAC domain-containing protein [Enterobacter hormaechei subsp. xiangfangensis]|uniref:phage antirepressor KilAC domain-containing protein n=1 Tax=Enterobacter hormaechei TaxID=158836 RepID=UPI00375481D7